MSDVRIPIQLAAQRTGLSAHVIRIWEKRYAAVTPARTGTKRRLYSEQDIERLGLLRSATIAGHRIGDIASLPTERLHELATGSTPVTAARPASAPSSSEAAIQAALEATREFDASALERTLELAAISLGTHGLLQTVIATLAQRVGDLWASGAMTAAHEHFATGVISTFLQRRYRAMAESDRSPLLVVVTPAGQLHELGAAIVSAAARDAGWRVVYLGASLPAAEIAGAARARNARAVALSIVYPSDDPALPDELQFLRRLLPPGVAIVAGGRAADAYAPTLETIGATRAGDLQTFNAFLDRLRTLGPNVS